MNSKTARIAGWGLTFLIVAFLGFSATMKFVMANGTDEDLQKIGMARSLLINIGITEAIITAMFLLPWTSFLGAILLTGYLGGAVYAHVAKGDPAANLVMPIVIGVLIWIALGLRQYGIFQLAFGVALEDTLTAIYNDRNKSFYFSSPSAMTRRIDSSPSRRPCKDLRTCAARSSPSMPASLELST